MSETDDNPPTPSVSVEELARVIAGAHFDNSDDDIPPDISRDEYIRRWAPHWLPEARAVLSHLHLKSGTGDGL
jgi:hypothetical protein